MKKIINPQMGLLAVGVLQPATAFEVKGFLEASFRDAGELPHHDEFSEFLAQREGAGHVVRISERHGGLYSLTFGAHHYLTLKTRKLRDKLRIYLLRDAYRAKVTKSRGERGKGLAGDSPAVNTSSDTKGSAANKLFGLRALGQKPYWPRISGQFRSRAGLSRTPRDDFFPPFLSFGTIEQATAACSPYDKPFEFDYVGLGLCLGISPKLISQIAHRPDRHYRRFTLPKKGGGEREIESPRVFLKTIQWFLADYILARLPVHSAVHSFTAGRSVVSNALPHVGKQYVGGMDIENFFGSVSRRSVEQHLIAFDFKPWEANLISRLCTNQDHLPQGAPTSPIISNSLLFEFDHYTQQYCTDNKLEYTRYADDITVSGDSRGSVQETFRSVELRLRENHHLRIRSDKTRISSNRGQQRITGVVVNAEAAPPRKLRRQIRAMFHQASLKPEQFANQVAKLSGYIGYLQIFPKLRGSAELEKYTAILRSLWRQEEN